jgi:signal transduction histidine kinase/HAMP domain-containing protein
MSWRIYRSDAMKPVDHDPLLRVARRSSITTRILALIVLTTGMVVLLLTAYFPAKQLEASRSALERKAGMYSRLISMQVASAIAFDDQETAREVFESVAQDPDVVALSLLTATGTPLYTLGSPGRWTAAVRNGASEQRFVELADRIGVVSPVVSPEGPRGTLVLEISTLPLQLARGAVMRTAALVGSLSLALGALLAFFIARSIGRRIQSIAKVAAAVAGGDLAQERVVIGGRDELSQMAAAFNAMLLRIQTLVSQIQQTAHEEQARLEALVRSRTAELHARNQHMRLVLDNVGQAFFTVDLAGNMSRERSAIVEIWYGNSSAEDNLFAYLEPHFPEQASHFRRSWQALSDGWSPLEVALQQLPAELSSGDRYFGLSYRPILQGGRIDKLLVVMSDTSSIKERQRAEEEEREFAQIARRVLSDRAGATAFVNEAGELMGKIAQASDGQLMGGLRALTGSFATFGFDSMVCLCHQLENQLAQNPAGRIPSERARLAASVKRAHDKIEALLRRGDGNRLEVRESDYHQVLAQVVARAPHLQTEYLLRSWKLEPTDVRLTRMAQYAEALARQLVKAPLETVIDSGQVRLDPLAWSDFWNALVHVVRNAIDHGIETSEQRAAAGKPKTGRLTLRTRVENGRLAIEVEDDGRGIDWAAVSKIAALRGLAADTPSALRQALLSGGLSTKQQATHLTGLGVGLAAAYNVCVELGGELVIRSEHDVGSTFRFEWPLDESGRPPNGSLVRTSRGPLISGRSVAAREKTDVE